MNRTLTLAFLGMRDFALPALKALTRKNHKLVGIVTQRDLPKGRGRLTKPNSIKELAAEVRIPVYQPHDVNSAESIETLRRWEPDLLVVVAYGQILRKETLAVSHLGGINLHASLLPAYRGAAPVAWAIYQGEPETGVTVIQMTPQLDAGDVLAQQATAIEPHETAGVLEARLAELGAPLICRVVDQLACGRIEAVPQPASGGFYARRLKKSDGMIDWSRPAHLVCAQIRAMSPWPTAYSYLYVNPSSQPIRVIVHRITEGPSKASRDNGLVYGCMDEAIEVQTGDGTTVLIHEVQPAGKRSMSALEFVNGYRVQPGSRLAAPMTS